MQPETTTRGPAILRAARLFRLGMHGDANSALVELVDELAPQLEADLLASGPAVAELIGHVLAAQERGDALRIADLLEFELLPRLADRSTTAPA